MRQEQTSIKAEAVLRKAFDEMNGTGDGVRVPYQAVSEWLATQKLDDLKQKLLEAETMFRDIKAEAARLTSKLPTVYEYLTHMRKQARAERRWSGTTEGKSLPVERRNRV